MAASDSRPIPRKNTAFRAYLNILDADGDPVSGATALDSEVSIDGGSFTDCSSEATEIGSSGMYYLDLTAAEMNGDAICVQVKTSSSGAKTTQLVFYPEEVGDIRCDTVQISGDSTAADNLELAADGTGYNLGGGSVVAASVTGAVGSVTGAVGSVTGNVGGTVASVVGAVASVTGNVGGNVTGSVGSVVGAVGSVTGAVGSVTGAVGSVIGNVGGNVVGSVASVTGAVGSVTGNVGGSVNSVTNKTGYALGATGLDAITITDPAGVASTFPMMVVQLWRRFFKKSTLTSTQLKTYADNGTTVATTQTVADDGTTQTQGAAG